MSKNALPSDFNWLWLGQSVSQFGSMLGALSLLALINLEATPTQMGLLETMKALPALLLGLFAGVWVDRLPKRPFLIAADLARFVLLLGAAAAALVGRLPMTWLYLVVFLTGSLTVWFNTAYRAYLPLLLPRKELPQANSRLATTESLAEIGAPGLGGLLVQLISAPWTIAMDALSFLLSAVAISRIRTPEKRLNEGQDETVWRSIRLGLAFVWQERPLRLLTLVTAGRHFFGSFFAALYGLFVLRQIGLSPATLGILVGAGGIGALIGAIWLPRLSQRYSVPQLIMAALLFMGLVGWLVPLAGGLPPIWAAAVLLINQLLGDIAMSIFLITSLTFLQISTPDALLGRANASFEFITGLVSTAGIVVGGVLGEWLGIQTALTISVGGVLIAALWYLWQQTSIRE